MPQAVTYSNFRANLKSYMRRVNEDADVILVVNADPADNVVVMGADDYDSLMETLRVAQNPYLSDKVKRGLAQVKASARPNTTSAGGARGGSSHAAPTSVQRLSHLFQP